MTQGRDNKAGITSEPLSICVILVIVNNTFVGAMIGLEQKTVVPLIGKDLYLESNPNY
jgi:hypothetical protein